LIEKKNLNLITKSAIFHPSTSCYTPKANLVHFEQKGAETRASIPEGIGAG